MKVASASRLSLGTVQFGLNYGVANTDGAPTDEEASSILEIAWSQGVRMLDTAAAYGQSEERLGNLLREDQQFRVTTKIPPLGQLLSSNTSPSKLLHQLYKASLDRLKRNQVHGLMFHSIDDYTGPVGAEVTKALGDLRDAGLVDRIGVSIYRPSELEIALQAGFDIVQIPASVLDQRFLKGDVLGRARAQGMEVHARSSLLQGLLLMSEQELPAFFEPIKHTIKGFADRAASLKLSRLEAAIGFCCSQDDIDFVVVGAEKPSQIAELCAASKSEANLEAFRDFAIDDENYILPFNWRL